MSSKKDLTLNLPKSKRDLTKENMLAFMKHESRSKEDKVWFVNLLRENQKKVTNSLNGEVVDSYDWPFIREEFAKKYFYNLSKAGKRDAKETKKPSFEEELEGLLV